MATTRTATTFTREIADLLASKPSREQILGFHPSKRVQERARELLAKSRSNELTPDEQWELGAFEHAELLMQLVKARIRAAK